MAILKIVPSERYTVEGAINYITDIPYHEGRVSYYDGIKLDPYHAARDMLLAKKISGATTRSQYKHIVISLEIGERLEYDNERMLFSEIGDYIACETGCQVVFAIHENTKHSHCHFVINSVKLTNNRKLNISFQMLRRLRKTISDILIKYGAKPILGMEGINLENNAVIMQ